MKKSVIIISSFLLFFSSSTLLPKLNEFGMSDLLPSHADDNDIFDQRISEELTNRHDLQLDVRHTESFTIHDLLEFIPKIKAYFENYLNHPDTQNPEDLELVKLAVIDVEKAKKMLKPQNITPYQAHKLRAAFNALKARVNAYLHTDKIEPSSYIKK